MHVTIRVEGPDRDREHDVYLTRTEDEVELEVDGERYEARVNRHDGTATVTIGDTTFLVDLSHDEAPRVNGEVVPFTVATFDPTGAPGEHDALVEAEGRVASPMPGTLVEIHVTEGDTVEEGAPLGVLEAMKMQSTIEAPKDGTVLAVHAHEGDAVEGEDVLFEIGNEDDE